MPNSSTSHTINSQITSATLIITLGIIYGDIGTSPLYVMDAIVGNRKLEDLLVMGGLSCIFWTLTLLTSIKYVALTLRADNNGEGGIFSLYSLVSGQSKWLIFFAILGGSTLLAEGMITPPISITAAIEGLHNNHISVPIIPIVIAIISVLFVLQQFGTTAIGKSFGPIMFVWFLFIGVLGAYQIILHPQILKAISPMYAIDFLSNYPHGFWLLGAVFLCSTGVEALYSDLGHCGLKNIRITWGFVKLMLLFCYFGQGAWLLNSQYITQSGFPENMNPFYAMIPPWLFWPGLILATLAAVIASQALISGSFTLVSVAIRLHLLPKIRVSYPSKLKEQIYIPLTNFLLWLGCVGVVLFFQKASEMEAAYGLSIVTTMIMTSILLIFYMIKNKYNKFIIVLYAIIYGIIEIAFLIANLEKFMRGGYVVLLLASVLIVLMLIWHFSAKIKYRHSSFVKIDHYKNQLIALSADDTIPKHATHLVYLTTARQEGLIEHQIAYSILQKQPKRADIYWFLHIELTDEPDTYEYYVKIHAEDDVIGVHLRLGYRVQQRVNVYFRQVVEDLVAQKQVNITSRYYSLSKNNIAGDFKFVLLEEYLSAESNLPFFQKLIMTAYLTIKSYTAAPARWFGLDTSNVDIEKMPLLIKSRTHRRLQRVDAVKDETSPSGLKYIPYQAVEEKQ
ncbi:MAG: KUP/HAK/KT family potassium transporter [Sphingobacteriales bacterium]|jgi:KUP system potassium uptake protein|nr:KUP/HAK/KT family potassium transporter [Sphingobacteriales bacterium]MBP9141809.1 KUP/HAK/KT family potassium transporter [Chitinophagales bacterium]MDA0198187.1 KUP/HAK/KT family potassium transporter [Bacteroidota bacterium]MBK7527985.1 KUP/HAK/KT family potassium transporter [Sphingobacteriales bacterium]MBK8678974.1 KUP/HAK/KT family potassium transporter [Sphingobacteriales bacterium]